MAVVLVGGLMMVYVTFGGMKATTWVQIIKAVLLLMGATFMAGAVLYKFGFSPEALFAKATEVHPKKTAIMEPGSLISNPLSAISLGLALLFGTAGLPHILMRFFTVKDAQAARKSVFYATGFIGYFYILTFIIGFGAIVLVSTDTAFLDGSILEKTKSGIAAIKGGSNMAAIHLANAVGGNIFLGFISAVAFATILAVVSGLALAGASSISHDLYAMVIKNGKANEQDEIRVSKIATLFLGVLAIILGIIFENQNVGFVLSPAVWEATLGNPKGSAPIPLDNPALFSIAIAFAGIWLFSILDRSARAKADRGGFDAQYVRCQTGIGASGATTH